MPLSTRQQALSGNVLRARAAASLAALALGACVVAAAGAGAGGGIYLTQRGAESVLPMTIERAAAATRQAFDELKVRETKTTTEQEADGEKREVEGTAGDREITVALKVESPRTTRVQVVAKRSAVTWDKDFARAVLDHIVAHSR
jgi:uncharacterized protein DUF3568